MKHKSDKLVGMLMCLLFFLEVGCAVQLKPVVHTVPYQSEVVCVAENQDCPWDRLEQQATFSALVNCLLSGATVLLNVKEPLDEEKSQAIMVPTAPHHGYETIDSVGTGDPCASQERSCLVSSRSDNVSTWAGCGSEPLGEENFRGGDTLAQADLIEGSTVVTGHLRDSTDTFRSPDGLEGPDRFFRFTLTKKTPVEIAVGVNTSEWSPTKGHRAPWQPGLFLLAADGRTIREGEVWRAGVTYLLPLDLESGTYYLIVDSSPRELARGNGQFRLYLGLNEHHMGPVLSP